MNFIRPIKMSLFLIVFILSFIASLILKEPLIFTVFVCLSLAVSFLLMIIMIFRFFKGKPNNIEFTYFI